MSSSDAPKPNKIDDHEFAKLLHDTYANSDKSTDKIADFDPESVEGRRWIAVASYIHKEVIDKLTIQAAAYMLKHHRNALYNAMPVGEVDAFDMLNIVNNHLNNVDAALANLKKS